MTDDKDALRLLVINGPNLGRLGKREPEIYGSTTLEQLVIQLKKTGLAHGVDLVGRQSNHEGDLVTWVGEAEDEGFHGILINPGALTHTSYALYDALRGSALPAVEVHISNPDAREAFRRESRIAPAVLGRIAGFGIQSYQLAMLGIVQQLRTKE
jgi:3-dehydroquinate dehydratase-2